MKYCKVCCTVDECNERTGNEGGQIWIIGGQFRYKDIRIHLTPANDNKEAQHQSLSKLLQERPKYDQYVHIRKDVDNMLLLYSVFYHRYHW